jgi:hypothetical protein
MMKLIFVILSLVVRIDHYFCGDFGWNLGGE